MGRRDSALVDSVISTVGLLAQGVSRFAYTAVVGRVLGADSLAAVNVGFAVAILLSLLWPTAAGNAAAAFGRADRPGVLRALRRSLAFSLIPLGLGAGVAMLLLGGAAAAAVQAVGLTAAWSAYIFARGMLIGVGKLRSAAVWDVVSGIVALLALAVFLSVGWREWALVPAVLGYLVFAVAAVVAVRPGEAASGSDDRTAVPLVSFIAWSSLALLATNGLMQVSMVVATALDTPGAAGQFAAALALATPASMVAQAVTQAMLPRFGRWSALPAAERLGAVRRATVALSAVMAAGCAIVAALLPVVLPLVYGSAFVPAVPLAQGLMVAVWGFSVSVFLAAFLATDGRARTATVCSGVGSVVGLLTMVVVGAAAGGSVGAVIGTGGGMSLTVLLLAIVALRPAGHSRSSAASG
ncbi:hypothetical protein PP359_05360 [Sphingomonas sp. BLCC-B65]|nr:hypothetical protein [Sphingomonas sp. BLCC-B65]